MSKIVEKDIWRYTGTVKVREIFSKIFYRESARERRYAFGLIYLSAFFYALHYALTLYIDSSFLSSFIPQESVGVLFAFSSALAIVFVAHLPKILAVLGSRTSFAVFALLESLALAALSLPLSPLLLVCIFAVHIALVASVFFSLDIIVESHSEDEKTGRIRGGFFTVLNIAILLGPLFASTVLFGANSEEWGGVYLLSSLALLPATLLIAFFLPPYREARYRNVREGGNFLASLRTLFQEKHLSGIFFSYFLLQFFYAWMVIYLPPYLHNSLGFAYGDILGIILPIALLPFVFFDFLLGRFADRRETAGEKKGIIAGFLIMGVATAVLAFLKSESIFVWAAALFLTRTGAATVEILCEAYFFKHISARDAGLVSLWRNISPSAFIVAPALAAFFLSVFHVPVNFLFVLLGAILFSGIFFAARLKS